MAAAPRVTIAGAGALGLATAVELAHAGCVVTVCEPAPWGANASGVAAGMLAPVFEAVLDEAARPHLDLLLAARDLWPALEARAGVALERSGAVAAGGTAWLAQVRAALDRLGFRAAELGAAALGDLAPGLAAEITGGLLMREDWRLEPAASLTALRRAAEAAGTVFRVARVEGRGDADFLVAATGWARDLAPELAGLAPIKGHILRVAVAAADRVTVRGEGIYAAAVGGELVLGATMEPGVADPAVDPAKAALLQAAGARLFPAAARAPAKLFAGIRAATPDGLPLAGSSCEPGVLVAAGARRNGWLLAPLVARAVAAQITGADAGPYAARLAPGRFAATYG